MNSLDFFKKDAILSNEEVVILTNILHIIHFS